MNTLKAGSRLKVIAGPVKGAIVQFEKRLASGRIRTIVLECLLPAYPQGTKVHIDPGEWKFEDEAIASETAESSRSGEAEIVRAYRGDRSANLEGIARAIDLLFADSSKNNKSRRLMVGEQRQLLGWAEQLRIIAKEIRPPATRPPEPRDPCPTCGDTMGVCECY